MFFRRERAKTPTTTERSEELRRAGYSIAQSGGETRVSRDGFAVDLREQSGAFQAAGRAGILMGDEIAVLVDGGFQKFFHSPSGKKVPATADQLKGLHDFAEDLKEALGMKSLYNESLGTVSTFYLYDRVKDRDRGVPKRIWE
jgi:hypothetical protein